MSIYGCHVHDLIFESCEVSSSQEQSACKRFPYVVILLPLTKAYKHSTLANVNLDNGKALFH